MFSTYKVDMDACALIAINNYNTKSIINYALFLPLIGPYPFLSMVILRGAGKATMMLLIYFH